MGFAPSVEGMLAPMRSWLVDREVSELLINKPGQVYIEKQNIMTAYGLPQINVYYLDTLCQLIANENLQCLSSQYPLLSGNLFDGSRIQVVMPPVSQSPVLSIRRKVVSKVDIANYVQLSGQSNEYLLQKGQLEQLHSQHKWLQFIELAVKLKKNVVISGGTSSGKTTFLNACMQYIPQHERILLLEDAREINLAHDNHASLLVNKGLQGAANISMQTLVQCCLRLRPDRIIVGELRGGEVRDFVAAASTGHEGTLTTIHANNPQGAINRMVQLYKLDTVTSMSEEEIRQQVLSVVDVVVQLKKIGSQRLITDIYFNH